MGGHRRSDHRHPALGCQGVERLDPRPVGPRGQARARCRAALAHRHPGRCQGPGRVGLLPAAGPGGPHAADPAAVLPAVAAVAPRHATAVPGAGISHGGADAAGLLGPAAGSAHGGAAGAGQPGGPLVAGGPDRPVTHPRGTHPCRARSRQRRGGAHRGDLRAARQLAGPPRRAIRLCAFRPWRRRPPLHHRQRARRPGHQRPGRTPAAPGHQAPGGLHPHPGPPPANWPARGHRRPLWALRWPGPWPAPAGLGGGRRGHHALPGAAGGAPARCRARTRRPAPRARDATADPLLPRLRTLCAQAQPPVTLTVHDEAQGQRLRPQDLEAIPGPLDLWFCGPQGLGDALHAHASGPRPWRLHRESFAMR